jgi:hypothetical protein
MVKDRYLARFLNAVLKKLFHMMLNLVIAGQMACHSGYAMIFSRLQSRPEK